MKMHRPAAPLLLPAGVLALLLGTARPAVAQTDYYNTDAGRPVRIEDAYPVERHAFELQLAPVRLERTSGGRYVWDIGPELAYGILPRTQVEVAFPLSFADAPDSRFGLSGVEAALLHNLNVETAGLPAMGLAAEVHLPVGHLAPEGAYASLKGILTRTYRFARFHLNGAYTFGPAAEGGGHATGEAGLARWLAGVAVDRTLPLRSMLVTAELFAEQPLDDAAEPGWNAGAGFRYQLDPRWAVDAGAGHRFGGDSGWFVTFGSAYAFAVRSLIPLPLR